MSALKLWIKKHLPPQLWSQARRVNHGTQSSVRGMAESLGLVLSRKSDFYSPLPVEQHLRSSEARWNRPSALPAVQYDLDGMQAELEKLASQHLAEFDALPRYGDLASRGFGPGYPLVDAFTLYAMIRSRRPRRYLEVGSGLSTCYARLASEQVEKDGHGIAMTCVEPFPYPALRTLQGIELIVDEVQNVPLTEFQKLEKGDILFIDSSHSLRIDSDVAYLFLDVLPRLNAGVLVHIHDVPFPFNTPYPADYWTLLRHPQAPHWPMYWNEAMMVQAFLAFNHSFKILMSTPLLRHFNEDHLRRTLPFSKPVSSEPNTFSSLWIEKIA